MSRGKQLYLLHIVYRRQTASTLPTVDTYLETCRGGRSGSGVPGSVTVVRFFDVRPGPENLMSGRYSLLPTLRCTLYLYLHQQNILGGLLTPSTMERGIKKMNHCASYIYSYFLPRTSSTKGVFNVRGSNYAPMSFLRIGQRVDGWGWGAYS